LAENKKIISCDFDGTLATKSYPECGELIEHAKEAVNALYDAGHYIIIWTCRMDESLDLCREFLAKHGIKHHIVNEHHPEMIRHYGNNTRKISADIYIDDKQVGGLPPWSEIMKILKEQHDIEHDFKVS